MDKKTFKLLKSIFKGCEIKIEDEKEMLKKLQQQAENSKNRLFQKLKEGSLENLIELQTRTMNEIYEIAHAADKDAENGKLDRSGAEHLAKLVANINVVEKCNEIIQERIQKIKNKKD